MSRLISSIVAGLALIAVAMALPASAQTSETFAYDSLGRLTKVTPSSGSATCYTHDPADNRTQVAVGGTACTSGGGGGGNSPPVAVNDSYMKTTSTTTWSGTLAVRSNDTDPDLPNDTLTITTVSGSSYASVTAGGGTITISAAPDGEYVLSYTIKDAANATSSATVNLTVVSLQ